MEPGCTHSILGDGQSAPKRVVYATPPTDAETIVGMLSMAAAGNDAPNNLLSAVRMMLQGDSHILRDDLRVEQRRRILGTLGFLSVVSIDLFPSYPPARFAAGINAAVALIELWPGPNESRKRVPALLRADIHDRAATFHAELAALVRAREETRTHRRRAAMIAAFLPPPPAEGIFG